MSGKVVLFAEGSTVTDPVRDEFARLWSALARKLGAQASPRVIGFSKPSILKMDPVLQMYCHAPLDALVALEYERARFDRLVIAFDTEPKHNGLARKCRYEEVLKVLSGFEKSRVLPSQFRNAAYMLARRYFSKQPPRPAGARLRGALDVVAMEPMFEALLLADETGVRRVLEVAAGESRWVRFKKRTFKPDAHILGPDTALAGPRVRRRVRGTFETNKHGWARYILTNVSDASPVWNHEIAGRLSAVLS